MAFAGHLDRLDEAVMTHLGDGLAEWSGQAGSSSGLPAILDQDVERTVSGMQSSYMERRTEMTLPSKDVGGITQGDTVTLNGEVWRWVSKVSDDGYLITGIVKPERI